MMVEMRAASDDSAAVDLNVPLSESVTLLNKLSDRCTSLSQAVDVDITFIHSYPKVMASSVTALVTTALMFSLYWLAGILACSGIIVAYKGFKSPAPSPGSRFTDEAGGSEPVDLEAQAPSPPPDCSLERRRSKNYVQLCDAIWAALEEDDSLVKTRTIGSPTVMPAVTWPSGAGGAAGWLASRRVATATQEESESEFVQTQVSAVQPSAECEAVLQDMLLLPCDVPARPEDTPHSWECAECTYRSNSAGTTHCKMCSAPRVASTAADGSTDKHRGRAAGPRSPHQGDVAPSASIEGTRQGFLTTVSQRPDVPDAVRHTARRLEAAMRSFW